MADVYTTKGGALIRNGMVIARFTDPSMMEEVIAHIVAGLNETQRFLFTGLQQGSLSKLVDAMVTIREEQVSEHMGFGKNADERKANATVYAAEIRRRASEIDDLLDMLVGTT